jgi:hypothetical protein
MVSLVDGRYRYSFDLFDQLVKNTIHHPLFYLFFFVDGRDLAVSLVTPVVSKRIRTDSTSCGKKLSSMAGSGQDMV